MQTDTVSYSRRWSVYLFLQMGDWL